MFAGRFYEQSFWRARKNVKTKHKSKIKFLPKSKLKYRLKQFSMISLIFKSMLSFLRQIAMLESLQIVKGGKLR